ncbi:MAG TPA: hypothetical protein VKB80_19730 [Kofleriaceae bacterium]|nr:hypothetical protein [Kofleriaceae bacterium]
MSRKPREEEESDEPAREEPRTPEPSDQAEPHEPEQIAEPDEPGEPDDSGQAAEPDEPDDAEQADEPDEPDELEQADEPDEPDDPEQVDAPPAGEIALAAAPPPGAFLKGAVVGLVLLVPLTALAVYVLGRLDIGDPEASYYTIVAFVAVFAGLPAIITVGGIGRAAASALVRPGERGGPSASTRVSAIYTAFTAVGLVLLTVVPLGEVPTALGTWLWIVALGGATGALGGFVLGLWVAYGSRKPDSDPTVDL